jgi:hypothetical protein
MRISHTTILLFALAVQIASADDKTSVPDFSHYQQTMQFQLVIRIQTNGASQFNHSSLLLISDFAYGSDRIVDQYSVNENGKGWSMRNVPDWAEQPGKKIKQSFSDAELKKLQSAIEKLPAVNVTPPLERLVIVSFKSGTNWVTHTYDRQSLPKAMFDICEMVDLGIETNTHK